MSDPQLMLGFRPQEKSVSVQTRSLKQDEEQREGITRNPKNMGDKVITRGPAASPAWIPAQPFLWSSMCIKQNLFWGMATATRRYR